MSSVQRTAVLKTLAPIVLLLGHVRGQDVVVGVNVVNPMRASVADQNAVLDQLEAARVHVIRCGISNDDKGIDYAKRASEKGIRILLGFGPQYPPNSPTRAYQPEQFPSMWGGHPLSYADPELSKAYYRKLFDALDASGIVLAGIELGNEINWAAFNAEFPLPGEGKILSLSDLSHDPEGKQIAKGFVQYLKILAVLKDVRDQSKLNRNTPLISAGMVSAPDGEKLFNNKREDMVSLPATMEFLRANGLDSLVDGYGIHTYPSGDHPGDPAAARRRTERFESVDLGPCRRPGDAGGKPCWITEWGFPNKDFSCPAKDSARALLVQEMRVNFAKAAAEHRLASIHYYSWNSDPWSKQPDADSVYRCDALTEAGRLAVAPLSPALGSKLNTASSVDSIRIRVGLPLVVRGPGPGIPDNPLSEIQLPNGKFRGFSASATTYAIDGDKPWEMGGKAMPVMKPGPRGQYGESGEWINHVERSGKQLFAWVHDETGDGPGMGLKSMSLAISSDDGLSWRRIGQIITGTQPLTPGKVTGEGDCTAVDGKDGYFYAYCWRNGDYGTIVARAPVSDPSPGKWKKYFNGSWNEPGLRGNASKIKTGTATARWTTTGETVNLGAVPGGMGIYFSTDHVNFSPLPVPLLKLDNATWKRPGDPHELTAYSDLLDAETGSNQLGNHWLLTYMYLQPNEGFDKRYQVIRRIEVSRSRKPDEPAVGVMLAHWYDAKLRDHWATTAPVPGNYSLYRLAAQSGYLLTAPDPARPTTELEDCVSQWPGHPDHILIQKGYCETHGYQRLRSSGFVYSSAQSNTQPLYRCYSEAEHSHFASNREDCENMGKREALLGHDLKQ